MTYDLNRTTLLGNITSDIELKQTPTGQSVVNFSIATNKTFVDNTGNKQEQAEFHNCILWGKLAEIASQYAKKGSRVLFEGSLQTRSWEAQDGTKRYKTEINGNNLILLGGKKEKDEFADSDKKYGIDEKKNNETIGIEDLPF